MYSIPSVTFASLVFGTLLSGHHHGYVSAADLELLLLCLQMGWFSHILVWKRTGHHF